MTDETTPLDTILDEQIAQAPVEPTETEHTDTEATDAAAPAPETEAPVEAEHDDETQQRLARLARDARESKRRLRQLESENQVLRGQREETPDAELERKVYERAQQIAAQTHINKQCNDIYTDGIKQFGKGEFDDAVRAVNEGFGQNVMPYVIETLADIPDASKLIRHLSDSPDILDDIAQLPPHRMGAALAREAAKIAAPKAKALSKAPPPIKPISTTGADEPEMDPAKMDMAQFVRWSDAQDRKRRFGS